MSADLLDLVRRHAARHPVPGGGGLWRLHRARRAPALVVLDVRDGRAVARREPAPWRPDEGVSWERVSLDPFALVPCGPGGDPVPREIARVDRGFVVVDDPAVPDELDYDRIDPGVREVVRLLRAWGLETVRSSDGRTGVLYTTDPTPVVVATCGRDELVETTGLLAGRLASLGFDLSRPDDEDGIRVSATYEPSFGGCWIEVRGLDDAALEARRRAAWSFWQRRVGDES